MSFVLALILKPFFIFAFFGLLVAPISWVLFKLIPDGELKLILFKVRTGEFATTHDKVIMTIAVLAAYVFLFLGLWVVYG
jgi:hypothetical protein